MANLAAITIGRARGGQWRATLHPAGTRTHGYVESRDLRTVVDVAAVLGAAERLDVHLWDDRDPPGGWVCAAPMPDRPDGYCGMPVESEPCPKHTVQEVEV